MPLTERQTRILRSLRGQGTQRIGDLAAALGVSPESVRRDIRPLVESGTLVKLHGAVSLPGAAAEAPFERRMREYAEEKRRIARHVSAQVRDGDSLMMDTGTTTSVLARELLRKAGLTVVTNSSDVARTLAAVESNRVYLAGGEVHGDNGAAFGGVAVAFLSGFRVRHAIISIAALDAGTGLMDYRLAEAEIARTVLGCGENRLVITDHTKFNRSAFARVAGFSDFDLLVTDRQPPPDIAAALAKGGARVEVAGPED